MEINEFMIHVRESISSHFVMRNLRRLICLGLLACTLGNLRSSAVQAGTFLVSNESPSSAHGLDDPTLDQMLTSHIARGVYRVAQGDPAFATPAEPLEVVTPDPASPAAYGNDIRNFHRAPSKGRWLLMISSPAWLTAMEGDLTVGGHKAPLDLGLDDMVDIVKDYLDYGVMLNIEARRDRWILFADLFYIELSGDFSGDTQLPPLITGPPDFLPGLLPRPDPDPLVGPGLEIGVEGDFKLTEVIAELGGGYRFLDHAYGAGNAKRISMDVIGGLRYWRLESSINADIELALGDLSRSGSLSLEASKDWVDPFVGLRTQIDITEALFLFLRGDIGGFGLGSGVSSEFTWKAQAGLSYNITPRFSTYAAYQILDVDYEDGGFGFDMELSGPMLGFGYAFGGPEIKE